MLNIINPKKIIYDKQNFNSKWEYMIYRSIKNILPQKYYPIRVNKKIEGFRLELDIYIPKLKLAFELQGPHHFQNLKIIHRDITKANICKRLGIIVVYLFYNKYYNINYLQNIIFNNIYKRERKPLPVSIMTPTSESDNASDHSLVFSDCSEKSIKKLKRRSKRQSRERKKMHLEKLQEHYKYIKSIPTEVYQPISNAIKALKDQCPGISVQDSSLKRHIIKHYKDILDCKKLNNRWMCSHERVQKIQFDTTKYEQQRNSSTQ
jgi:hypothetical protein